MNIIAGTIMKKKSKIHIVTEGDSWFHLPGRNIVNWIKRNKEYDILRLEHSGDEIAQVISGNQKQKLRVILQKERFDYLLFSAGGNDLLGESFFEMLQKRKEKVKNIYKESLRYEVLNRRMEMIKLAYEELFFLRDTYQPNIKILSHSYDYVIPHDQGIGFLFFKKGPWINPQFTQKGWKKQEEKNAIIKILIDTFYDKIKSLELKYNNFKLIDTRGVAKSLEDWGDEIHLSNKNYKKVSEKFIKEMKSN